MKRPVCTAGGWTLGAVAVLVAACRVYGIGQYPAAAVLAGTAVGATAAHRSVTGGCWAVCSHGWHCDRDSGLCVQNAEETDRREWGLDAGRADAPAAGCAGSSSDIDAGPPPAAAPAEGQGQLEGAAGADGL